MCPKVPSIRPFGVNLFQVVSLLIRVVHLDHSWSSVVWWFLGYIWSIFESICSPMVCGSRCLLALCVVVWIHLSPLAVLMVPSDLLCFIRFSGVASRWLCLSHLGCSVCPIWVAVSVPSALCHSATYSMNHVS